MYPFDINPTENVPPDISAPAIRANSPLDPRDILYAQHELQMLKLLNGKDSTVQRADTTAAKSAAREAVVSSIHAAHGSGHAVLMQKIDRKLDAMQEDFANMKTDFANMKTDFDNMQTDIAKMTFTQAEMKVVQDGMNGKLEQVNGKLEQVINLLRGHNNT